MNNTTDCVEVQSLVAPVLAPLLILDLVLIVPGNVLALWLIGFKAPWKSPYVFLLNLALSDMLLLLTLPFSIHSVIRGSWIFGDAFCRVTLFTQSVHQSMGIALISVMSVDRYFRIVHPFHDVCKISVCTAVKLVCVVWGVAVTLRLPLLVTRLLRSSGNRSVCQNVDIWTESGPGMLVHSSLQVMEFAVTLILLIFSFVCIYRNIHPNKDLRKHRRIKRSIYVFVTMMITCAVCLLPGYITGLMALFLQSASSCSSNPLVGQIFTLCLPLTFLKGALDPVLYTLSCRTYRDFLKAKSNTMGLTNLKLSVKETRPPRRRKPVLVSFKKNPGSK